MSPNSQQTYKHAIFDFDGVLCDSLGVAIEAYESIRVAAFPELPPVLNRGDFANVYRGSLRTCLHRWLSEDQSKRFFDLHSKIMEESTAQLRTFEGAGIMLTSLGHHGFSIVTSAYSGAVKGILSTENSFDPDRAYAIAGRELHKSKTAKINDVLVSLGLTNDQAVYVGDLQSDILYCREVPIDIISVSYGYHPRVYLEELSPKYLVDSVEGLNRLLNSVLQNKVEVKTK